VNTATQNAFINVSNAHNAAVWRAL
jgi:hypothetical protein